MKPNDSIIASLRIGFFLLSFFGIYVSKAQNISIRQTIDSQINVCGQTKFTITVRNDENTDWNANLLSIQLPCGFTYVAGSVSGAAESNVINTSVPRFDLGNIGQKTEKTFSILTNLSCTSLECLNAGFIFKNEFLLTSQQGQKIVVSDNFNVETANLVMTKIEEPFLENEIGTETLRKISVKNTRLGRVQNFVFEDYHEPDLEITFNQGITLSAGPGIARVVLGAEDFRQIGNQDDYFDFNEEIVITEKIFTKGCLLVQKFIQSELYVSWGCEDKICNSHFARATFKILPKADNGDKFTILTQTKEPDCYVNGVAIQNLKLRVAPTVSDLIDVNIKIEQDFDTRAVLMESAVLPQDFRVSYENTVVDSCGNAVSKLLVIQIDTIFASSSFQEFDISFQSIFCAKNLCNPPGVSWDVSYKYEKACSRLSDKTHTGKTTATSPQQNPTFSELLLLMTNPVTDGKAGAIRYNLRNENLTQTTGILVVKLTIPALLKILNTNYALGAVIPAVQVTPAGLNNIIELTYPLPLSGTNQILTIPVIADCSDPSILPCKDSLQTSCLIICQEARAFTEILAEANVIINPDCPSSGLIKSCAKTSFVSDCTAGECIKEVDGYVDFDMVLRRLTLGLPDKNNDQIPDTDGIYDESQIKRNQVFLGDTFELKVFGEVIVDKPGATFENAVLQIFHDKLVSQSNVGSDIIQNNIKIVNASVRLWDASENMYYSIPTIIPDFTNLQYTYDLSSEVLLNLSSDLPSNFVYEDGDSITLTILKVFNKNFPTPFVGWNGHDLRYEYRSKLTVTNEIILPETFYFGCGCPVADVVVVGFNYWTQWAIPGITQCPGQSSAFGMLFNYGYPIQSTGEVKFYMKPSAFRVDKVDLIRLDSVAVSSGIFPEKTYKVFMEDDDSYYIDIEDFAKEKNFRNNIRFWLYRSSDECISAPIAPAKCDLLFYRSPLGEKYLNDKFTYSLQNVNAVPNIDLEIQQRDYTAITKELDIPFKIINKVNSQVRNVFIRPIYDEQSFFNVKLELAGLPVQYPDINGYYVLGNLFQSENRNLRFKASSINCNQQKIVFEYGYDCDVYSNPAERPCLLKRDSFFIEFPEGELDINSAQESLNILLCDTIQEFNFTVFNSGLGYVFDVEPTINLPRGVQIVENSCRIIFPAGSGQSFPIPSPVLSSGTVYKWELSNFWDDHKNFGLASVSEGNTNAFQIVYQITTDCDFISGTSIKYGSSGQQVCGKATNMVTKTGPLLTIPGNEPDVNILLNIESPDTLSCGETKWIHVQYDNQHTDASLLSVLLPESTLVVSGSFTGNIPVITPFQNNGVLEWDIPEGISAVDLQFEIQLNPNAGCTEDLIEIYTTSGRETFCVASQNFCDVQNISGKAIIPVTISKSRVEIVTFDIFGQGNNQSYILRAEIFTNEKKDTIRGNIYYDVNGDNLITNEDIIIGNMVFDPQSSSTGFLVHESTFNINLFQDACRLFLVLDQDENCICEKAIRPVNPLIEYPLQEITLCWNEGITLGVNAQNENLYQWNVSEGLSCSQCANPSFSIPNSNNFISSVYDRILTETSMFSNCTKRYSYEITVLPKPRILSTLEPVCSSETIQVFTTDFSETYEWSGYDLIINEGSNVKVSPDTSGWLYVDMTDSNGCSESDSIYLVVYEIPAPNFIKNHSFCFGQEAVVGYIPSSDFNYTWIDPQGILLNPDDSISTVSATSDTEIYLQTNFEGCERTDTVSIVFYDEIVITGIQDTFFVCTGDSVIVSLEGANNYDWGANFSGDCLNDSCSLIRFIPLENQVYTFSVEARDSNGCSITEDILIVGFTDIRVQTSDFTICQGDSIVFGNNIFKEAGIYCDTLTTGNCKNISCINLTVTEPAETNLQQKICEGQTFVFMGQVFDTNGNYTITTQNIQGCDSIINLEISIIPLPNFDIDESITIDKGQTIQISLPPQYTYQWTPSAGLNCMICNDVVITGSEDIVYNIIAFNELGCTTTQNLSVIVRDICVLESINIPNSFSPNGDDINDEYTIPDLGICEVKITIFNRWGNVVYTQFPFNNAWKGISDNGSDLPQGTYYILLESANVQIKRTGMIDLRRQ
ncbi:MAG: gliding motility-associated C-terminal domain-containing protein [Saprospiraceae bacterium]|nr:gliding motility-associated C-terminal domain-containing protein [Saprospiraceae bacterium]